MSWDQNILTYTGTTVNNPPWDTTFINDTNALNGTDGIITILAGSSSGAGDEFALADLTFFAQSFGSTDMLIGTSDGGCVPGACGVFSQGSTLLTDYTPVTIHVVLIPAAFWLFSSGLLAFIGLLRKQDTVANHTQ